MGRVACTHATRCVFTSDNPRTEPPGEIIRAMLQGVPVSARSGVMVHPDRARAIREAINGAAPGDVIVIAGRGHETEQEVAAPEGGVRRIPLDDRVVAREALRERRLRAQALAGETA